MFGEDDIDSPPHLSSPWEAFSNSPSPCSGIALGSSIESSVNSSDIEAELMRRLKCEVPRLVPEVEEGNVEYKLKLSPSPERLTRLITQLKWRLLEGGGQALYEIGVGDDGQLVGLPRKEMEKSLDALERMAGELGATVVVAREIVVPKGVLEGAESRTTDTPKSGSSADDLETFLLELESPGSTPPSSHNSSQINLKSSSQTHLKPIKNNRRNKIAQKAEHKRIRREAKRSVNAAYANTFGMSPSEVEVSNVVPPGLGIPEIIFPAPGPETVVDLSQVVDVVGPEAVVPVDSAPVFTTPDPDEVIIVEALVVRKLALEEAFLDFGGFSVLG